MSQFLGVDRRSVWAATPSFFPLFAQRIRLNEPRLEHLIVGAGDGKFVTPMLSLGCRVVAIEQDSRYVYGTHPELINQGRQGLIERFDKNIKRGQLVVLHADYMQQEGLEERFASAFTSCSWHYSCNANYSLSDLLGRLQSYLMAGGYLGADFMMPIPGEDMGRSHYPTLDMVLNHFDKDWAILLALETRPFAERAHIDNEVDHFHRMGFVLAQKNQD